MRIGVILSICLAVCVLSAAPSALGQLPAGAVQGDFDGDGRQDRAEWVEDSEKNGSVHWRAVIVFGDGRESNTMISARTQGEAPANLFRVGRPGVYRYVLACCSTDYDPSWPAVTAKHDVLLMDRPGRVSPAVSLYRWEDGRMRQTYVCPPT